MFKKIIITGLLVTVIIAIGASAYNAFASQVLLGQPTTNEDPVSLQGNKWQNGRQGQTPAAAESVPSTMSEPTPSSPTESTSQDTLLVPEQNQGNPEGNGQSRGRNGRNNRGASGEAIPEPQNGLATQITFKGVVSQYIAPNFNLITADDQIIPVQLGNLAYIESLGLQLQDGDTVIVSGNYDSSGGFTVGQITLVTSGETYQLRDSLGRPLWSGGRRNR